MVGGLVAILSVLTEVKGVCLVYFLCFRGPTTSWQPLHNSTEEKIKSNKNVFVTTEYNSCTPYSGIFTYLQDLPQQSEA
jgi:hypothetical protein